MFKASGNKRLPGHVTGTRCRPDITAAFESDWEKKKAVVHWPFVRLAGEQASLGKSRDYQKIQAISYLHYLLLARPDLYVAQGVLTSESSVKFLFGVGGRGVWEYDANWNNPDLYKFLYGFIYRLYDPGHFADSSYIGTEFDKDAAVTYTINITTPEGLKTCNGFYPIYARNPFASRTHVLSNPNSKVQINGSNLTILKDQLCWIKRRFKEYTILNDYVHQSERVPGVVVATHSEEITYPLFEERCKRRLGLEENGLPFMDISTPYNVLETLFDVLEGI